ncbi:hypothetical protein cyc_07996 [Cyclospora cayetanensis]|uniref:Uncharacterized protein n=1 Tax=Cyclospora cayetanensis TaxID=88456 RepID=A0A1D3D2Y7_9EIME|nr:hypothetical protein cyc_07996 [Cyclospora cayetanensis]
MLSGRAIRRILKQGVQFFAGLKARHPLASDLIERLLTFDVKTRMQSAYEALHHPWLLPIPSTVSSQQHCDLRLEQLQLTENASAVKGELSLHCSRCVVLNLQQHLRQSHRHVQALARSLAAGKKALLQQQVQQQPTLQSSQHSPHPECGLRQISLRQRSLEYLPLPQQHSVCREAIPQTQ